MTTEIRLSESTPIKTRLLETEIIDLLRSDSKEDDLKHVRFLVLNDDTTKDKIDFICPIIRGRLSIVGSGSVEDGEEVMTCLSRELKEEVGVTEYSSSMKTDHCYLILIKGTNLHFNIEDMDDSQGFQKITLFFQTDIHSIKWSLSYLTQLHRDKIRSLTLLKVYLRLSKLDIKTLVKVLIDDFKECGEYQTFVILKGLRYLWELHYSIQKKMYSEEYIQLFKFIKDSEEDYKRKKFLDE